MAPRPVKHPKPLPALVIDASPSLRAVVYGKGGHVTLLRGREAFSVSDIECERVEWARRVVRGEEPNGG